ncbi:MAG: quinolinate synthase NadA [Oscillospiraceae bacterium]|jgi:quinolinate synthase|nr:quinolinate synthase NadA [Oscillospiraceae bacterium]
MSSIEKIKALAERQNALVLAHYYQSLDVQACADKVGDSFALAKYAKDTDAEIIILCGVRFMAESAKILSPGKTVYLPAPLAGCPMADMVTPDDVLLLRAEHPDAAVVCYVNSSAAVKAVSDVCCTSGSAVKIVNRTSERDIIFVPDRNLGGYVAEQCPDKNIILFAGYCPTHHKISEQDIVNAKAACPGASALVHPECRAEVRKHADYLGSTAGIIRRAEDLYAAGTRDFLIGTEIGVLQILQRDLPDANVRSIGSAFTCPNMKKTGPDDILACLNGEREPIVLDAEESRRARLTLEKMVEIGG